MLSDASSASIPEYLFSRKTCRLALLLTSDAYFVLVGQAAGQALAAEGSLLLPWSSYLTCYAAARPVQARVS